MALQSSIQLTQKDPSVISNATIANAFMFFLADGTGGTIANGIFKKDSAGVVTPLLPDGSVSNAMHADMAAARIKGRAVGAGTGPPTDLTEAQVVAILAATFPLGTGAWTSFTPAVTQGVTLTKTVVFARYIQVGKTVTFTFQLAITSAGTAGSFIRAGLPVAPASDNQMCTAAYTDASPATAYVLGGFTKTGTNDMLFLHDTSGSSAFGAAPAITAASGDVLYVTMTYEAA